MNDKKSEERSNNKEEGCTKTLYIKRLCIAVAVLIGLYVLSCLVFTGLGKTNKDGITHCKNCGRTPVYAVGFCKICYEDFINYTYKKK